MILLASDYDGTLKRQGKISETDIMAIQNFQREGNLFSLITGRSISMIRYTF